ncbi:ANTAR domain-containing response regulator [Paraburkholderia sp. GAS334]|uniref:ANTAR domain-containing response regulator n=1 Tax=Paraburkholderia sp. GAS334 TaxID=3035131 RepID=UPI003D22B813
MTRRQPTSQALQDIRSLRIAVVHSPDQDRDELLGHLKRIGCKVQVCWPNLDVELDAIDLVIMSVNPQTAATHHTWLGQKGAPPIIPVVTYENPVVIEAVMLLNAFSVIPSPVRSFGVLTAIAVTVAQHKKQKSLEKYIQRAEEKASKQRTIELAKSILMKSQQLSEEDAYRALCLQARDNHALIEAVADEIVRTDSMRTETPVSSAGRTTDAQPRTFVAQDMPAKIDGRVSASSTESR